MMALFHFILAVFVMDLFISTRATSEEAFIGQYPSLFLDTEDANKLYSHADSRAYDGGLKQSETRRRSTLDKNFARFGRGGGQLLSRIYFDDDLEDAYERPTRSGEKSDQFIRFGRGKSDFVRFGRNPKPDFVRFGRSKSREGRKKRELLESGKRQGSNFVRFGRNENFMRFGRPQPQLAELPKTNSTLLKNHYLMKMLLKLIQQKKIA